MRRVFLEQDENKQRILADRANRSAAVKGAETEAPSLRGLGDLVEMITTATGIKAVVKKIEAVTGVPCGCGKRREALNRAVPFD